MERIEYVELNENNPVINVQKELKIYDLVAELLSISFEKYDIEVVTDFDDFAFDTESPYSESEGIANEIIYEEMLESKNSVKLTMTGNITSPLLIEDGFTMMFSLNVCRDQWNLLNQKNNDVSGVTSMHVQFSRKVEQFSDPVFKVIWNYEDAIGCNHALGKGDGILILEKNANGKPH